MEYDSLLTLVHWCIAIVAVSVTALVVVWCALWIIVIVRGLLDPDYAP